MRPVLLVFSPRNDTTTGIACFENANGMLSRDPACVMVQKGCFVVTNSVEFNRLFEALCEKELFRVEDRIHVFELGGAILSDLPLVERRKLLSLGLESFALLVPLGQKDRQLLGLPVPPPSNAQK